MTVIGQSTFVGGDVTIVCDGSWTCCQRQQAREKVKSLNDEIKGPPAGGLPIRTDADLLKNAENEAKELCQADAWRDFKSGMKKDPDATAKKYATHPCQEEELKQKWKSGKKSSTELGVQMDHPVEVKFGGPANTDLRALDTKVNNFFGGVSKNTGNNMLAQGQTTVDSVTLICPADKKCPEDNSEPKGKQHSDFPKTPGPISPKRAKAPV